MKGFTNYYRRNVENVCPKYAELASVLMNNKDFCVVHNYIQSCWESDKRRCSEMSDLRLDDGPILQPGPPQQGGATTTPSQIPTQASCTENLTRWECVREVLESSK